MPSEATVAASWRTFPFKRSKWSERPNRGYVLGLAVVGSNTSWQQQRLLWRRRDWRLTHRAGPAPRNADKTTKVRSCSSHVRAAAAGADPESVTLRFLELGQIHSLKNFTYPIHSQNLNSFFITQSVRKHLLLQITPVSHPRVFWFTYDEIVGRLNQ